MKKYYFLLAILLMTLASFAQPTNDDCANAELLTISKNLKTINFFPSTNIEDNHIYCSSTSTYESADIWYQFEMPFDGNIIIDSESKLNFFNLFDACGGTISCPSDGGLFPNLTANTVYLLRVLRLKNFITGNANQFTIRAHQKPTNDTCDTAETILMSTSISPVSFEITGSSLNYEEYCSGLFADIIDIWYDFIMPIDGDIRIDFSGNNSFALYDTCNGTSIYCNLEMGGIFQNLTAGSTYKLRVFRSSSYSDETFNKLFKISIIPTLGVLDESENAVKIYPNPATETVYVSSAFPLDKIEVYDILGQQIASASNTSIVNVEKFCAGVYFLKIYMPRGFVLKRIVKK